VWFVAQFVQLLAAAIRGESTFGQMGVGEDSVVQIKALVVTVTHSHLPRKIPHGVVKSAQ
jgi:hypothetical protein